MFVSLASRFPAKPKDYYDLFFKQESVKTFRDADGNIIKLDKKARLNTIVVSVENNTGTVEEIIVNYLGNKLLLRQNDFKKYGPKLVSDLKNLGEETFTHNSEWNLVANSFEVKIDGNESLVEHSTGVNLTESPRTKIIEGHNIEVRKSPGVKVQQSGRVGISESPETDLLKCSESFISKSEGVKGAHSSKIRVDQSSYVGITRSPGAHARESERTLFDRSAGAIAVESPYTGFSESDGAQASKSFKASFTKSPYVEIVESPRAETNGSKECFIKKSPDAKLTRSLWSSIVDLPGQELDDSIYVDLVGTGSKEKAV